jgi:hypothetical protein
MFTKLTAKQRDSLTEPYCLYVGGLDLIFVRLLKSASSSLVDCLADHMPGIPAPTGKFMDRYSGVLCTHAAVAKSKLPRIAVVRNPFSRLVSLWAMVRDGTANKDHKKYIGKTFAQFLDIALRDSEDDAHVRPYTQLLIYNGRSLANEIYRFEQIAAFWPIRPGMRELQHFRKTDHTDYKTYYNKRQRARVARYYAADLVLLGYGFDRYYSRMPILDL